MFYDHVNPSTRKTIDQVAGGKLHDKNAEESWALLEDLALYDNENRRLIELENQVQRLMEAHLALNPQVQVNKITSSCEICSGPHDTQCCMENPEQAFVDYASSHCNEVGGKPFTTNQGPRNFNEATNAWKDMSHPAKAEARGATTWISLQHNNVYYRVTKRKRK
ncbi:hypothetical protein Tco_1278261 [Tanacetum coccineum]